MDPVSESCLNLAHLEAKDKARQERYNKILGSCVSVSNYEEKSLKNLLPQITAALAVMSYRVVIGISLSYSAILLPQLQEQSDFTVSKGDASWIASIIALTTPFGSVLVGLLIDRYGRLFTMKMTTIPGIIGWVTIATAWNVPMLIIGRALTGFANALGANPPTVYLSEIARKDMRGSLLNIGPALASSGMILTFLLGWALNWRQVAWGCAILTVVPSLFVLCVPESPAWLVAKNRIDDARKALEWFNRYQPRIVEKDTTIAEMQLALLQQESEAKKVEEYKNKKRTNKFKELFKPRAVKPFIILIGLSLLQQFTGIFIFLFYSITFFREVGAEINPYLASIFIGILRLIICLLNTYIMKIIGRRPLILLSFLGMSICIFASAYFTCSATSWAPVVFLLLFVMSSMVGVVPIPFTMAGEVFPLEIRGVAYGIIHSINSVIMFAALRSYPVLLETLGGIKQLQVFFGAICLVGFGYSLVVLPETHKKKLSEVEAYFRDNFIYLLRKKSEDGGDRKRRVRGAVARRRSSLREPREGVLVEEG